MHNVYSDAHDLVECHSGEEALEHIKRIYNENCDQIKELFNEEVSKNPEKYAGLIAKGLNYPYVGIKVDHKDMVMDPPLPYGVALDPGVYGTTVTRPDIFGYYYREQIDLLIKNHKVPVVVGLSDWPIPFPFVPCLSSINLNKEHLLRLGTDFVFPNLTRVNDDIANNRPRKDHAKPLPLAFFTAERVDYSISRLYHYTATAPNHFQDFILLTNYQRYIDEFIEFAKNEMENGTEYSEFVQPGDHITYNKNMGGKQPEGEIADKLPQMPAYHLKRPDHQGITFINIGVGPSNAKTITDHLAVLRPHCWIMLGHCAGLRRTQLLGDYVLAHAYVREDKILDDDLSLQVPIPAIAEVQVALQEAVGNITGLKGAEAKIRLRTGTVLTTLDRQWELRSQDLSQLFKQTRAIAVDMESATIAANGFRFRVPYGTLLCVSDKPIHGEIKLRGTANAFYSERVSQHLMVGIETIKLIRDRGVRYLHSRKLRGFDEPPFR